MLFGTILHTMSQEMYPQEDAEKVVRFTGRWQGARSILRFGEYTCAGYISPITIEEDGSAWFSVSCNNDKCTFSAATKITKGTAEDALGTQEEVAKLKCPMVEVPLQEAIPKLILPPNLRPQE